MITIRVDLIQYVVEWIKWMMIYTKMDVLIIFSEILTMMLQAPIAILQTITLEITDFKI